jgi:hypothetical protein
MKRIWVDQTRTWCKNTGNHNFYKASYNSTNNRRGRVSSSISASWAAIEGREWIQAIRRGRRENRIHDFSFAPGRLIKINGKWWGWHLKGCKRGQEKNCRVHLLWVGGYGSFFNNNNNSKIIIYESNNLTDLW